MGVNKSKPYKKPPKIEWKGYLNVNLSPDDETLFEAWEVERTFGIVDVGVLVDGGYKFSLNWDSHHNGFTAGLYSGDARLAWTGWTLTAWAGDIETAMRLLFFKHYVMCEEDWERFTGKVERMNRKYG
jgi:hypothetical protein